MLDSLCLIESRIRNLVEMSLHGRHRWPHTVPGTTALGISIEPWIYPWLLGVLLCAMLHVAHVAGLSEHHIAHIIE